MNNLKLLHRVVIGAVILVAVVTAIVLLLPCKLCAGEKEIGMRLGIDGDATAIGNYMDQRIVVGQMQTDVFAFYRKANPNAIEHTPTLGNLMNVPNASCYRVRFDDILAGNLLLNRIICFDGNDKLISIDKELIFY